MMSWRIHSKGLESVRRWNVGEKWEAVAEVQEEAVRRRKYGKSCFLRPGGIG